MIAGVCSGFAEYFAIDPTIIRIITIIITLAGMGFFAYIIAAIIMPSEEEAARRNGEWGTGAGSTTATDDFIREHEKEKNEWDQPVKYNSERNRLVMGAILVGLGILFLGKQFFSWFDLKLFIPLLLIGIGGVIIFKGRR